jgi:hypothetical protein
VNEYIAASFYLNETVSLGIIEPLYLSSCHPSDLLSTLPDSAKRTQLIRSCADRRKPFSLVTRRPLGNSTAMPNSVSQY